LFYEFTDHVVLYIQAIEVHTEQFVALLISRAIKLLRSGGTTNNRRVQCAGSIGAKKYQHTLEPVAASARGGKIVVSTKLTGNFPGSPVTLDFVFTLEGGKIAALEIKS